MSSKTTTKSTIKATGDFVIVRPTKPGRTPGGIELPQNTTSQVKRGQVVSASNRRNDDGEYEIPEYAVGDTVLYLSPIADLDDGLVLVHKNQVVGVEITLN